MNKQKRKKNQTQYFVNINRRFDRELQKLVSCKQCSLILGFQWDVSSPILRIKGELLAVVQPRNETIYIYERIQCTISLAYAQFLLLYV